MDGQDKGPKGAASFLQQLRSIPEGIIPAEQELIELVEDHLVTTGAQIERKAVVTRTVALLIDWYRRHGKAKTLQLIDSFLIRRSKEDNAEDNGSRNRGDTDQSGDSAGFSAVDADHGPSGKRVSGNGGLQVLEGGGGQRTEEGSGAPERVEGAAHKECPERSEGISRRLVELELAEHRVDLQVFQKAYSGIRARVRTVEDEARLMKLATWSGTTACLGLLELVIHNIERVVGELGDILKKIEVGEIPNLDEESDE